MLMRRRQLSGSRTEPQGDVMLGHPAIEPPPAGASPGLRVLIDVPSGCVQVCGELDRTSAHYVLDALATLAVTPHRLWTVDASQVTFCDVEGLRVLIQGQALAVSRGHRLRLLGARPFLRRLLAMLDIQDLMDPSARPPTPPRPRPQGLSPTSRPYGQPESGPATPERPGTVTFSEEHPGPCFEPLISGGGEPTRARLRATGPQTPCLEHHSNPAAHPLDLGHGLDHRAPVTTPTAAALPRPRRRSQPRQARA